MRCCDELTDYNITCMWPSCWNCCVTIIDYHLSEDQILTVLVSMRRELVATADINLPISLMSLFWNLLDEWRTADKTATAVRFGCPWGSIEHTPSTYTVAGLHKQENFVP